MTVSTQDAIPRVRDQLGELGDQTWITTGSAASTVSSVVVASGTDWDVGSIGEFESTGGEQFKVLSVSGNTLTVVRGWAGTSASIQAADTVIIRDPIFSYRQIEQALIEALNRLWPYCFIVENISITPSPSNTIWYNLTDTILGVLSIIQLTDDAVADARAYGTPRGNRYNKDFNFERGLPTALVASGTGITFPKGVFSLTNTIYIRGLAAITGSDDIEDSTRLPVANAVVTGALARLCREPQFRRIINTENVSQSAQTGSLTALQMSGAFESAFQDRLNQLALSHSEIYGTKVTH